MSKIAFLFSGQGAQHPGMMADVFAADPGAKALLAQADALMDGRLSQLILEGPAEELNKTENTQPAMVVAEIAALQVLQQAQIKPDYIVGFSLGEWAALVAAGVISFEDCLQLVRKRAQFMQTAVPIGEGGMAVILGKSAAEVDALCAECDGVTASNYNCPGQVTVSGKKTGIDRLLQLAAERGIIAKLLPISVPSHCAMMQGAADRLDQELAEVSFADACVPLVMNCTAQPTSDGAVIKQNMISQLTQPVRFEDSVRYLLEQGVDTFVEIGPGKTLVGLVKKTAKAVGASVTTVTTDGTMENALAALKA